MGKKFATLRIPEELMEEMKVWKTAFERSYNRGSLTYEFMLRGMLDSLELSEPDVVAELDRMMEEDPSLMDRMCNYRPSVPEKED